MKNESKLTLAIVGNKTKAMIWWIITSFSAVMCIACVAVAFEKNQMDTSPAIKVFVIAAFLALAVWGVLKIRKLKKQSNALKNYKEYIARLSNDKEKSLIKLARSMDIPLELVESHIDLLIKMGLIKNAYIDKEEHKLVLPEYGLYDKKPDTVMVAVKCDCCSGTTAIPQNTIGTCQYCGSPVSAK